MVVCGNQTQTPKKVFFLLRFFVCSFSFRVYVICDMREIERRRFFPHVMIDDFPCWLRARDLVVISSSVSLIGWRDIPGSDMALTCTLTCKYRTSGSRAGERVGDKDSSSFLSPRATSVMEAVTSLFFAFLFFPWPHSEIPT